MAATNKNMIFDVNLLPATTGDHNLGSSENKWNLYVNQIKGESTMTGNLTLQKFLHPTITGTGTAAVAYNADTSTNGKPALWTFDLSATPTAGDIITITVPVAGHSNGVFISTDNGANYKPVSVSGTSRLTTHFGVGTTITLVYDSNGQTNAVYPVKGGTATTNITGGCWQVLNYYVTSYSAMTKAEAWTGTAMTSRAMRADYLKDILAKLGGTNLTLTHDANGIVLNHDSSGVTATDSVGFYKVKYDAQGHITGTTDVVKNDITTLLGTDSTHNDTFLRKDGSWAMPSALTDFKISQHTIPENKGVRITFPTLSPVLISCQRQASGGRLILLGGGYNYNTVDTTRNNFTEVVSCSQSVFTWSSPISTQANQIPRAIEIMNHKSGEGATVWVWTSGTCDFKEITALTTPATNAALLNDKDVTLSNGVIQIQSNTITPVSAVASTDEAIVRFNGESGQVQNSGIIINDNNRLIIDHTTDNSDGVLIRYVTGATTTASFFMGVGQENQNYGIYDYKTNKWVLSSSNSQIWKFYGNLKGQTAASVTEGTTTALTAAPGAGEIQYLYNVNQTTEGLFNVTNDANSIITLNNYTSNYCSQLGVSSNGNLYYRSFSNQSLDTTTAWKQIAFTDSINVASSLDTTSKIYLIGAENQIAYAATKSNSHVYATNGALSVGSLKLNANTSEEKVNIEYNTTSECITFSFE